MTISEKVAYLKGLAEGLEPDGDKKEVKLINAIVDVLSDMATELEEIDVDLMDMAEGIDDITEELEAIDEYLFDDDDFDLSDMDYDNDYDDDDGCGCEMCGGNAFSLSIDCPACGDEIEVSEVDLSNGLAACSSCGEKLEFEYEDTDDELESEDEADQKGNKKKK